MLPHPVTLYWHQADQFCFVVPPSSWVPCKKRPLPFLNVFGMTRPSSNRESNPQILLVSAGSPLSPFTISRGYWGPICYQGAPSGAPTPDPHGAVAWQWVNESLIIGSRSMSTTLISLLWETWTSQKVKREQTIARLSKSLSKTLQRLHSKRYGNIILKTMIVMFVLMLALQNIIYFTRISKRILIYFDI